MTPRTRRAWLAGAASLAAETSVRPLIADEVRPQRIVALEWSIVSMLLSIGVVPVGIGETDQYEVWVKEPALPAGVANVGIRNEPSLEALASLRPDLILVSPLSRSIVPLLSTIAPTHEIAVYTEERAPLRLLERELRNLGRDLGRAAAAEAVIARSDALFGRIRDRLAGRPVPSLLVVSFSDARHLRVFGPGSLFGDVLDRIGLRNAWTRVGSVWGSGLAGTAELAAFPDASIVIVEPVPAGVARTLAGPGLWANLPSVRAGRVVTLPAVWQTGDHVAADRFAGLLLAGLEQAGTVR